MLCPQCYLLTPDPACSPAAWGDSHNRQMIHWTFFTLHVLFMWSAEMLSLLAAIADHCLTFTVWQPTRRQKGSWSCSLWQAEGWRRSQAHQCKEKSISAERPKANRAAGSRWDQVPPAQQAKGMPTPSYSPCSVLLLLPLGTNRELNQLNNTLAR